MAQTVIVPNVDISNDILTHARWTEMKPKRGCTNCMAEPAGCPECLNDLPFYLIWTGTTDFWFEFQFPDIYNPDPSHPADGWGTWIFIDIVTPSGTLTPDITDISDEYMVGYFDGLSYQVVNLDKLNAYLIAQGNTDSCFYLKIRMLDQDDATTTCYTKPFKRANCLDVVTIEGVYKEFDCDGTYYGDPDEYVGYKINYRNIKSFQGTFEITGYPIDNQLTDEDFILKKVLKEQGTLRTYPLDEWAAKELSTIIMGRIFINDIEWLTATEVAKNNDVSSQWLPELTLVREICQTGKDCDI